jgi:glycosyltransferase involved in cell wall biosynthesis
MSTNASSKARERESGVYSPPLRILHCMRAPVGGLFRHVYDLARGQAERGHRVGIVADSTAADPLTIARLKDIEPALRLGLALIPMSRQPGLGDIKATGTIFKHAAKLGVDILHGHGAKGGAYARLVCQGLRLVHWPAASFYTPHGGSLHYKPGTIAGAAFIGVEHVLRLMTDGLIFESNFAARAYRARIGTGRVPVRIIPNGLGPEDFAAHQPNPDASDFLFVGELRHLKGVDVLLHAVKRLKSERAISAVIVGAGPDAEQFKALAETLGVGDCVTFPGAMPAREAFAMGRVLVVPSRAESLPYIVLEGGAAGLPVVATDVGGIPEIVAGTSIRLTPAGDAAALADAMALTLTDPSTAAAGASELKARLGERFTVAAMTDSVLDFYTSKRTD